MTSTEKGKRVAENLREILREYGRAKISGRTIYRDIMTANRPFDKRIENAVERLLLPPEQRELLISFVKTWKKLSDLWLKLFRLRHDLSPELATMTPRDIQKLIANFQENMVVAMKEIMKRIVLEEGVMKFLRELGIEH